MNNVINELDTRICMFLEQAKIVMEVALLQDEITTKERLILELEQSERRMAQIRRDYERKLQELSERIAATESERDKIILEMSKKSNNALSEEKIKEIKQDYEKRLGALRTDFNKMKSMQSEHERARQHQAAQQAELQRTRRELDEMKKSKVKLVQEVGFIFVSRMSVDFRCGRTPKRLKRLNLIWLEG